METRKYKRIIVLILDSVGCGFQPDNADFDGRRANTLDNIYKNHHGFSLPNLEELGLGKLLFNTESEGGYVVGKMQEKSMGNDTFAGVSEMLGHVLKRRFRSVESGFPDETVKRIERELGCGIVGNEYISGFKALDKYYDEHRERGAPILYIAEDGVVLLAAHEDVIDPEKLNYFGERLASILSDQYISRVITRPFVGVPGNFIRTESRKDFLAYSAYQRGIITDAIVSNGVRFITTEHLYDLMGQPKDVAFLPGNYNNRELLTVIASWLSDVNEPSVMLFCLQDFDMFGHKKDGDGYALCLQEFDSALPGLVKSLNKDDLLMISADHGCDPYVDVRGHTREYVPLIIYSGLLVGKKEMLGTRETFSDIAQTICYNFKLPPAKNGRVIYEIF